MDWYRTKYDAENLSGVTFTLSEGEASETLLTSADLDRDGEDEEIWLEDQPRGTYELVVKKQDGTELYREGARGDRTPFTSIPTARGRPVCCAITPIHPLDYDLQSNHRNST